MAKPWSLHECVIGALNLDQTPCYVRAYLIRFGDEDVAFSARGDSDRSRMKFLVDCANREQETGKYHNPSVSLQ